MDQPTLSKKRRRLQKNETTSQAFSDRGIPKEVVIQTRKSKEPQNTSGIANATSRGTLLRHEGPLPLPCQERFKGKDIVSTADQMNMFCDEITPLSPRLPESNSNQGSICFKMPKIEPEPIAASVLNDNRENCTLGNKNYEDDITGSAESALPIAIIYPDDPYSIINGMILIYNILQNHSLDFSTFCFCIDQTITCEIPVKCFHQNQYHYGYMTTITNLFLSHQDFKFSSKLSSHSAFCQLPLFIVLVVDDSIKFDFET